MCADNMLPAISAQFPATRAGGHLTRQIVAETCAVTGSPPPSRVGCEDGAARERRDHGPNSQLPWWWIHVSVFIYFKLHVRYRGRC